MVSILLVPPRMRRLLPLALTATLLSACTMTPQARTGTILGGVAMGAAGMVAMSMGPVDSDNNGSNDYILNDNLGAYMLGSMLITGGIALLIAGLTASEREPARAHPPLDPRYAMQAPAAPVAYGAPPSTAMGMSMSMRAPEPAFAPPGAFEVDTDSARLPELPATPEVLRIAKQVRLATANGRCDHAWSMWTQLSTLDTSYAVALRHGPVMARCPAQ